MLSSMLLYRQFDVIIQPLSEPVHVFHPLSPRFLFLKWYLSRQRVANICFIFLSNPLFGLPFFTKRNPSKFILRGVPYRFIFYNFAAISYIKDMEKGVDFRQLPFPLYRFWEGFEGGGASARHEQGMPACGSIPQPWRTRAQPEVKASGLRANC